jgi:ParB-like chromosome segregation protein Spo0J
LPNQDTVSDDVGTDESPSISEPSFANWNPSKNQKILLFKGREIEYLKESPQIGRWGGLDDNHVTYLAGQIARDGQRVPVGVRKGANGEPELYYGRHRKAAILLINADPSAFNLPGPIPLKYVYENLSEEVALKAAFSENTGKPLTVVDLAHAATRLSSFDYTNDQVSAIISSPHHTISPVRVSQLKALMRLPHSILTRLHNGDIPESAARAMLSLGLDSSGLEEIATQLEKKEIKAGDIIKQANERKRTKGKKVRRSLLDVKELLIGIDTASAADFLSWLDGEHNDEGRIIAIFDDENFEERKKN